MINHCHYRKIEDGDHFGGHPRWTHTDEPFMQISVRNWADIELYMYAKHLFVEQAKLIGMHPEETVAPPPVDTTVATTAEATTATTTTADATTATVTTTA